MAMHNRFAWKMLALFAILKLLTTVLSFASGTPGGLYAPVLFIGAMMGASIGSYEQHLFPYLSIPVGAYALVGMGALFAGIMRAPMTSVFMILEVSGNYSIILPVIISNSIAYVISRWGQPTPLFDLLSRQDGLDLPSLEEESERTVLTVEDAMRPVQGRALLGDEPLSSARALALTSPEPYLPVDLGDGRWSVLSREAIQAEGLDDSEPVRALVRSRVPRLHQDQSLEIALRFVEDRHLLPVVHRGNLGMLIGVVSLEDILRAYRRAGITDMHVHES